MEIKSYKKIRSNLYELSFKSGEKYKIYDDIILKYELLIEKELTKKKLDRILEDNALLEAYYRAVKYINTKMRTELEIKKFLERYDFSKEQTSYAVSKLRSEGYIDEEKYVRAFINDSLNLTLNGPKKIREALKKLGVAESLIDDNIKSLDDELWFPRIRKIVEKKAKVNKAGEKLFKSKVYSDLIVLGYYNEDIKEFLEDYHIETGEVFVSEADKVYIKLSSKYEGIELELKFKSKMFSKGFDMDVINEYLDTKK